MIFGFVLIDTGIIGLIALIALVSTVPFSVMLVSYILVRLFLAAGTDRL